MMTATEHQHSLFFAGLTPEQVYERAQTEGPFLRRVCLFSGGNDSLATAIRCAAMYDELVHIETGTALPGVLDHVHACAEWLGKPLLGQALEVIRERPCPDCERIERALQAWRGLAAAKEPMKKVSA